MEKRSKPDNTTGSTNTTTQLIIQRQIQLQKVTDMKNKLEKEIVFIYQAKC